MANRKLFISEGPPWIDLALALFERKGGIPRLLHFAGRSKGFCSKERWASMGKDSPFREDLEEAVLTGANVVEKEVRIAESYQFIPADAFYIRGWVDEGYKEQFEGWYDPQSRTGVIEIKHKEER